MYDWANSAYSLVIVSAIFPIYFEKVTSAGGSEMVSFLGMQFVNSALFSYLISFAFLIIAIVSPMLSGIADYGGYKKRFMQMFCYLGSISCAALFFFQSVDDLLYGAIFFVLASVGFAGSIVFYNSFLPEIAEPKDHDRISARGFAMGYIGSSLLLIFNLLMIMMPQLFFDVSGYAQELVSLNPELSLETANEQATSHYAGFSTKISFVLVGVWWAGFAQITFAALPTNIHNRKSEGNIFLKGYRELMKVWEQLNDTPRLKIYLAAFFFSSMGVQTVMYVATLFGVKELSMETSELIITLLLIQFVAIGGAFLFSWLSSKFGNVRALIIANVVWICICIGAYFVTETNSFYMLAFVVGMVMGGIQSLSRSTYSKLLPKTTDHASYFSFYDVCERVGVVLGTLMYGMIEESTGSMRNSVIALVSFFVVGVILLFFMPARKGHLAAA